MRWITVPAPPLTSEVSCAGAFLEIYRRSLRGDVEIKDVSLREIHEVSANAPDNGFTFTRKPTSAAKLEEVCTANADKIMVIFIGKLIVGMFRNAQTGAFILMDMVCGLKAGHVGVYITLRPEKRLQAVTTSAQFSYALLETVPGDSASGGPPSPKRQKFEESGGSDSSDNEDEAAEEWAQKLRAKMEKLKELVRARDRGTNPAIEEAKARQDALLARMSSIGASFSPP